MAEFEVWGFAIKQAPSGRNIWPIELKKEATRRIREEGRSLSDIAVELGAHEGLVRKWYVADRRMRGETIVVEGPAFAELSVNDGRDPSQTRNALPSDCQANVGRIRCGAMSIEFPLGISEADLAKLLRVAGQAQ